MPRVDVQVVKQARENLAAALPVGHPVQSGVDSVIAEMWEELCNCDLAMDAANIDVEKAERTIKKTERLMDVMEDWRRGVRDWSEVEAALKEAGLAREDQADKP